MISSTQNNFDYFLHRPKIKTQYLNVRSFKFYADGALGSRGACLKEDYQDKKNWKGFLLQQAEYFRLHAAKMFENGFQMNTHCIGDSSGAVVANTSGGTGPFTFTWNTSPLDTTSHIEKIGKGFYTVMVTDANGCQAAAQDSLREPATNPTTCQGDKNKVLVPSAFSPNGDNVNDRLVAIMKNVQQLQFRVFNRWGEMEIGRAHV